MNLAHEVLQLDVSGVYERHLEAMQVQVGEARAREDAGGAVVVRMDVGDHQAADALGTHVPNRGVNRVDRFVGVHAAVHEISLVAIGKEEDVDQAVLEWDRQAQLEDVSRHLGQSKLGRHDSGIVARLSSPLAGKVARRAGGGAQSGTARG